MLIQINQAILAISGFSINAFTMYWFDPVQSEELALLE